MPYEYEFPRPAVSVDIVVFQNAETETRVLLIQRLNDPYKDCWALPGGFLDMHETLEEAAIRELREETMLETASMQQLGAFSTVNRDPRGRVISFAFTAQTADNSVACAADDAKSLGWFSLNELPELAFDHQEILQSAIDQRTKPAKPT